MFGMVPTNIFLIVDNWEQVHFKRVNRAEMEESAQVY